MQEGLKWRVGFRIERYNEEVTKPLYDNPNENPKGKPYNYL